MRYDVFLYISNGIEYVMSYLHLVFKMNKKKTKMKYILFFKVIYLFKVKIISNFNILY